MKIIKPFLVMALVIVVLSLISPQLLAQTCISCDTIKSNVTVGYNNNVNSSWENQSILGNYNTTSRNNAVAIGTNSTASWSHSYVFGSSSSSNGIHSYTIGSNAIAQSTYSYAIGQAAKSMFGNAFAVGNFTRSDAVGAYVFGLGVSSEVPLVNNVGNSLVIGFKSTKPTLFVSESEYSANYDLTGKVGIGNVTSPQAKLHIRGDAQEDATLLLEPSDYRRRAAALYMLNINTGLFANLEEGLHINTDLENGMNFNAHFFNFRKGKVGINVEQPEFELDVHGQARVTDIFMAGALQIGDTTTITGSRYGRFANGTALTPAYSFSGNANTGMFRPSSNTIAFSTAGTEKVRISSNGNVGIGIANPEANLEVKSAVNNTSAELMLSAYRSGQNNPYATIWFRNLYPSGSSDQKNAAIKAMPSGANPSNTNNRNPSSLTFWTQGIEAGSSPTEQMRIDHNGNVGIGTHTPAQRLHVIGNTQIDGNLYVSNSNLLVSGEIHAKKFRATLDISWPDYVFDPSYNLLQLDEVEKYIHTHRHLPGIPPAAQVEKEGFELAEMNALLLKKIEELTLYVIEQQKQINALNQRFAETE